MNMQNTSSLEYNQRTIPVQPRFCAIVGPTASGKTDLAIALAKYLGSEILCVDAIQVYRGLNIGSAKPGIEERNGIVHHGLDLVSPLEQFSASRFESYAEKKIKEAVEKDKMLVLCGGTGLYYRALLEGFFEAPDPEPELRAELYRRAEKGGLDALYTELESRDFETAQKIHPNDARRIIRALEIIMQTGVSVTELRRSQKRKPWFDQTVFIGIQREREDLVERIQRRTDWMYENGLVEETRWLLEIGCGPNNTAMQALGYKECYEYLLGKYSLQETVEITARETGRYARRQMTWFRRQCPTKWVNVNNAIDLRQIVEESLQLWRNSDNNILL